MVFGYTPLGSGGMLYCNQIPFPLREGGLWARDYITQDVFLSAHKRIYIHLSRSVS